MAITKTYVKPLQGQSPIILHNVPQSITVGDITGDKGTNEVWADTKGIEDFTATITTLDEYSTGVPYKKITVTKEFDVEEKTWGEGEENTEEAEEKTFDISYKGHERDFEVKVLEGEGGGGNLYYKVNPEDMLEDEYNRFMIILKDSFEEGEQLHLCEGSFSLSTAHQAPYVYTIPSCVPVYGGKSCVFPDELTESHHLYTRMGVECEIEEVLTPSNIFSPIPPNEYLNSDYFTPFDSEGDGIYVFISEDSSAVIEYYPLYNSAVLSILNFPVFPKEWCQYFFNESTAWYYASDAWEPTEVRVGSPDSGSSPKLYIRYRWGMNDSHDLSVEKDITITERPTPSEGGEEGGGGSDESDILMFDTMPTGPYNAPTTYFAIHKKYLDDEGVINGRAGLDSCMACLERDSCTRSPELDNFLSNHEDYEGYCTTINQMIFDPTKFRVVANIGPETLEWLDNDVAFSDSIIEAVRIGDGASDGWIPIGFDLGDLAPSSEDARYFLMARLTSEDRLADVYSTAYPCGGGCADCPWDAEVTQGTLSPSKVYICQQESNIPEDDVYAVFLIRCDDIEECPEGWVKASIAHQNVFVDDFWVCPVKGHISKDAIFPKS